MDAELAVRAKAKPEQPKLLTYIATYGKRSIEVNASSEAEARHKAADIFQARRLGRVVVKLKVDKQGDVQVHIPAF